MGDRPAPDLFTALSLEPARAAPPIEREDAPVEAGHGPDPSLAAPQPTDDVDTAPRGLPEIHTRVVEPAALAAERLIAAETAARSGIPPSPFGGSPRMDSPMPPPPARPMVAPGAGPSGPRSRAPQRTEVVPPVPPRPARRRRGVPPPAAAPAGPSAAAKSRLGLADLLEPGDGRPAHGLHDLAPVPSIPPSPDWDDAPRRNRGIAWIFVPVSLVLAGTLLWVLYTQTDLFSGDIVAERDAEVAAEAQAEQEAAQQAALAAEKERGTFTISSEPSKARVWMVKDGPEATFANLPIDGEYMVAVTAEGHQPRVRVVKGTELVAPVVVDLDPLPPAPDGSAAPAPAPEIPPAPVPKVGRDAERTTALVLRSNTPGAALMLLVGYTPGATVVDLDVRETHRFLVTLEGHEPHAIELKGRHWEETEGGGLAYDDNVTLAPRAAAPKAGSPPAGADAEGDAKGQK